MWIDRLKPSKLGLYFFLKAIAAALLSVALYLFLLKCSGWYCDRMEIDSELYQSAVLETVTDFQAYVTEHDLSTLDTERIRTWDRRQGLVDIWIIKDNRLLYDSLNYLPYLPKVPSGGSPLKGNPSVIHFSDGDAYLTVKILYRKRMEDRLDFLSGLLCILLFCAFIFQEFSKLVKTVLKIKKGILILESGDLGYHIEVDGNDELRDLADSINRMSQELESQRILEEHQQNSNYKLVTSISHDIRTPLTSIISYLDLLLKKQSLSPDEQRRYLQKIKDKAYLIKDLTDNLFQHFISKSTAYEAQPELITGNDFLSYLLTNLGESLTDQGFIVNTTNEIEKEFYLTADALQIIRVFNNLEGNLIKYADKQQPITYHAVLEESSLIITGFNHVARNKHVESYGLGIQTCRDIIRLHGGIMDVWLDKEGPGYHVKIILPVSF